MSLEAWLKSKEMEPRILNPLEEVVAAFQKEHSGSGMKTHLSLMPKTSDPIYECFCRLKKYGVDTFDPSKMPTYWKGCGECV